MNARDTNDFQFILHTYSAPEIAAAVQSVRPGFSTSGMRKHDLINAAGQYRHSPRFLALMRTLSSVPPTLPPVRNRRWEVIPPPPSNERLRRRKADVTDLHARRGWSASNISADDWWPWCGFSSTYPPIPTTPPKSALTVRTPSSRSPRSVELDMPFYREDPPWKPPRTPRQMPTSTEFLVSNFRHAEIL